MRTGHPCWRPCPDLARLLPRCAMLCVACAWSKRGGMSRFSFDRKQRAQRSRASAERTRLASAPPPPEPQPLRSAHGSAPPRGCRRGTGGGAGVGGSDQTQSRECRASGISRVTREGRRARRPLTPVSALTRDWRQPSRPESGPRTRHVARPRASSDTCPPAVTGHTERSAYAASLSRRENTIALIRL